MPQEVAGWPRMKAAPQSPGGLAFISPLFVLLVDGHSLAFRSFYAFAKGR